MEIADIKQLLEEKIGVGCILDEELQGLQPTLVIHRDFIVPVCTTLKQNEKTWFDFLSCLSGVDYGVNNGFGVVYHLASIPYKTQLTLKVRLDDTRNTTGELPWVYSVSNVWRTADWHEREAYDLVGIFFRNHPDLRRILLPDDWQGYPLRKDYQDAETYHGIPIK